jgi:hypothetical protein
MLQMFLYDVKLENWHLFQVILSAYYTGFCIIACIVFCCRLITPYDSNNIGHK